MVQFTQNHCEDRGVAALRAMRIMEMTPQTVAATIAPSSNAIPSSAHGSLVPSHAKISKGGSDVDLIVELDGDARLGLGFMDVEAELTRALRHAVDVRTIDRQRSIRASLSNFDYERMLVYERASR